MTYYSSWDDKRSVPAKPVKPTVYLTPVAHRKLTGYARLCPVEVSGMGFVDVLPDDTGFLVTDLFCPPQEGSASGTDLNIPELHGIVAKWIMDGEEEKNTKLRCWFHSHAKLATFWSTTDTTQMASFDAPWMISIVTNHAGDILARLDIYQPLHLYLDDLPVQLMPEIDEELEKQLARDIAENVTTAATTYAKNGYGYGGYGSYKRDKLPYHGGYGWGDGEGE